MAVKKTKKKPANVDLLITEMLKAYEIPTRKDYDRLYEKLETLERMIKNVAPGAENSLKTSAVRIMDNSEISASGAVLQVIKNSRRGADFSRIKLKTGFEDKKLRNIIFRLNKIEKIKRKARGIYVAV
jgi:hypothetical protein